MKPKHECGPFGMPQLLFFGEHQNRYCVVTPDCMLHARLTFCAMASGNITWHAMVFKRGVGRGAHHEANRNAL